MHVCCALVAYRSGKLDRLHTFNTEQKTRTARNRIDVSRESHNTHFESVASNDLGLVISRSSVGSLTLGLEIAQSASLWLTSD